MRIQAKTREKAHTWVFSNGFKSPLGDKVPGTDSEQE